MSKEVEEMIKIYEELLNNENTEYLINYLIRNYKNGIIFCGVGKNWYIAEKLCKTALSMGIPARRSLTEAEGAAWPAMRRAAALRFWLLRLEVRHQPRAGEVVTIKNPDDFRHLLARFRLAPEALPR